MCSTSLYADAGASHSCRKFLKFEEECVVIALTSQEILGRMVLSTSDGKSCVGVSHDTIMHCLSSLSNLCLFSVFCKPRLSSREAAGGML